MANFAEVQSWHRQEIVSVVSQDSQVRELKKQFFGGDLHGGAAYTMFLESQLVEPVEELDYFASVGYYHATVCVVGTWLETHRGEINRPQFPIDGFSLKSMYTIFKDFRNDHNVPTGRRDSPHRMIALGLVKDKGRILTEEDFPSHNFAPGIRLPLGILFDKVREDQAHRIDAEESPNYQLGFDLGVSRWRELSTVA